MKYHARAGKTHHLTHAFTHIGFVAMHSTISAGWFALCKLAIIQSIPSIAKQLFALGTKVISVRRVDFTGENIRGAYYIGFNG